MNYIIAHCNPENNWLSTTLMHYTDIDGYTVQKNSITGDSLSGSPVFESFQNTVSYFLTQGGGQWSLKQIKCTPHSSYEEGHYEPYTEEVEYIDESGETITETISSSHWIVDKVVPVLNMRIVQSSNSISNSEKFYFIKTTELPKEVESCVIDIWNYTINNNDV